MCPPSPSDEWVGLGDDLLAGSVVLKPEVAAALHHVLHGRLQVAVQQPPLGPVQLLQAATQLAAAAPNLEENAPRGSAGEGTAANQATASGPLLREVTDPWISGQSS